jgi:hypothetical protein
MIVGPISYEEYKSSAWGVVVSFLIVCGLLPLVIYQLVIVAIDIFGHSKCEELKRNYGIELASIIPDPMGMNWHLLHALTIVLIFLELVLVNSVSLRQPLSRFITGVLLILTPQMIVIPSLLGYFPIANAIPISFFAGPMFCLGVAYYFSSQSAMSRHCTPKYGKNLEVYAREIASCDDSQKPQN